MVTIHRYVDYSFSFVATDELEVSVYNPDALFRKSPSNNTDFLNSAPGVVYGKLQDKKERFYIMCMGALASVTGQGTRSPSQRILLSLSYCPLSTDTMDAWWNRK